MMKEESITMSKITLARLSRYAKSVNKTIDEVIRFFVEQKVGLTNLESLNAQV